MGNQQGKESRPGSSRGPSGARNHSTSGTSGAGGPAGPSHDAHDSSYNTRGGRGNRLDLPGFGLGTGEDGLGPRRETKAEREARKLEKERVLRAQERERSIREENVDGGYLVTLGTYTGPEDFNKGVVRQLQIERRLAPFWKGLNDHSDTWTEHQLIAVVNGLPLPAADEIPPEEPEPPQSNNLSTDWSPRSSSSNINNLTVPITARSLSQGSDRSANITPFAMPAQTSSSPFFRGRAKTLAALAVGSRNNSQTEMTPQEVQLPKDRFVNGQRIEVFLYKDASECPICFLYYPPYLNKTRCCDQPICSECFVQIKRPDPHPPEHQDPSNPSSTPAEPQDEVQLVSEPAACPFCVQPDFGVTYDPPPFRRGLAYANQVKNPSAMSSSSSLNSQGLPTPGRRRATSLAANDASVITTDRVRPDWSKKLADARAHALRRAAAATALHNAAYMMGNLEASSSRGFSLGRRRRTMFGSDSAGSSGHGTPQREGNQAGAAGSSRTEGHIDLLPGRGSSRRTNRIEDLEELMMMEAIRLSLAAEEERKKKEEKEAAKEAKKEEKRKAKEAKKAEKASRRGGSLPMAGTGNLDGEAEVGSSASAGKGKEVDRSGGSAGFNPLTEPTSTLNASSFTEPSSKEDSQRHLETKRAEIQRESSGVHDPDVATGPGSSTSSLAGRPSTDGRASSSSLDRANLDPDETPQNETPGTEPMFNFSSLEAVISKDCKDEEEQTKFIEDASKVAGATPGGSGSSKSPTPEKDTTEGSTAVPQASSDAADDLEESVVTLKPSKQTGNEEREDASPSPEIEAVSDHNASGIDTKHIGEISMGGTREQPTQ